MAQPHRDSFLDGAGARVAALIVLCLAIALVAYYHRADLVAGPPAAQPELNPQFVECRAERTGQVDRMREEGVITDAQYAAFRERAVAFCAGRFPPEGNRTPPG